MAEITENKGGNKGHDNLIPIKKGEVRNPTGRPLGQRNYATIYREALLKLAELNNKTPDEFETEMLSKGLLSARSGDYRFYKDVLDRLHGTATQKTDVQIKAPSHEDSDVDLDKLAEEVAKKLRPPRLELE